MTIDVGNVSINNVSAGTTTSLNVTITLTAGSSVHLRVFCQTKTNNYLVSVTSSPSETWTLVQTPPILSVLEGTGIDIDVIANNVSGGSTTITTNIATRTSGNLFAVVAKEITGTSGYSGFYSSKYYRQLPAGYSWGGDVSSEKTAPIRFYPALLSGFAGSHVANDSTWGAVSGESGWTSTLCGTSMGFSTNQNYMHMHKRVTVGGRHEAWANATGTTGRSGHVGCLVFTETGASEDPYII